MAYDRNEVQAYITEAARRRGIDPATALRVIRQESGFNPAATNLSPKEKSYGLMQLNTQGGLGVHALEKGIDIRNPETWRQQVDFGLDTVAKDGWRQWYGARDVGIGRWDGIGGSRPVGPGAQPDASPLTQAVAERGGSGASTLAGGPGGDQIASGGAGPAVNIGLKPERSTKAYDAMLDGAIASGSRAQNGWDVAGSLAQVYAATRGQRNAEDENASELQKALASANLDPSYAMVAQLSGGREGAASAILAQQSDRAQAANRAEQRSNRLSAQEYQQEQDRLDNARADKALELQGARANEAPSGYRWNADRTGYEPIAGGPADPSRPDPNFKPSIQSVYTDDGREQKGYFDQSGQWVTMGGSKAPSAGGGGVTISPDGTIQVGGSAAGAAPGTPTNIPSGFMVDPSDPKRLTPIPGGPGEQIGGENAGRIGIAKSFLEDLPGIREEVRKGGATGIVDAMAGKTGIGQAGQLYARIESGADALQRMLSGAGMPESEAQAYARRYMPSVKDSPDIVAQKLTRLETELQNQMAIVTRGRGDIMGAGPPAPAQRLVPGSDVGSDMPARPGAPVDYRNRYGLE